MFFSYIVMNVRYFFFLNNFLSISIGGTHRTPVKQKMKTMSRSLQMLNVARLNVKAQKNQAESEQLGTEGREADRTGKRRSSDRNKPGVANVISTCTFSVKPYYTLRLQCSLLLSLLYEIVSARKKMYTFPKMSVELLTLLPTCLCYKALCSLL